MPDLTYSCQRARALASRRLDDELSEVEAHVLERHLRRCPGCASFSAEIAGIATMMRATPLEPYRIETLPRLGRSTRSWRGGAAAASAATLVAAAVLGVVAGITPPSGEILPTPPTTTVVGKPALPAGMDPGRGVPIVTHLILPLGQRNAVDDF